MDRARASLTRTQTHNLQQDLKLSLTLGSGQTEWDAWGWDDTLSFGALETINGTPMSPESPVGRRLPGPREGPWGSSSPVGTVAHRGQHPCLVQVSWEAVQHPPFLDAVLFAQTLGQSLGDDAVWHCRGRRIRAVCSPQLSSLPGPRAELLQRKSTGTTWTRSPCGPATSVAGTEELPEMGNALGGLGLHALTRHHPPSGSLWQLKLGTTN